MQLKNKVKKLNQVLSGLGKVLIAFSGGTDSALLLACAVRTLGRQNVLAVTAVSETYSREEIKRAKMLASRIGARLVYIKTGEMNNIDFLRNPRDRCFHCKNELFKKLQTLAKKHFMTVCDGSNYSDKDDIRPGRKAAAKWGVISPLELATLKKIEIRQLSKEMGLPSWNFPQAACLASRFPYGKKITVQELRKIEKGEALIRALGFRDVRIRHHGDIARIEIEKVNRIRLLEPAKNSRIIKHLKKLGWKYITIDLEGYRTGSLN